MRSMKTGIWSAGRSILAKPVLYGVALVIILGPAVYRFYKWRTEAPSGPVELAKPQAPNAPGRTSSPQAVTEGGEAEGGPAHSAGSKAQEPHSDRVTLSMNWAEGQGSAQDPSGRLRPRTWEKLQQARTAFEERVLKKNVARRLRVETPSLVRRPAAPAEGSAGSDTSAALSSAGGSVSGGGESGSGDAESAKALAEAETSPGYVAYVSTTQGFEKGVDQVMEEIAEEYVQSFPEAPRVTVGLIVGGGIRKQGTFINDGSGGVKRAGQ